MTSLAVFAVLLLAQAPSQAGETVAAPAVAAPADAAPAVAVAAPAVAAPAVAAPAVAAPAVEPVDDVKARARAHFDEGRAHYDLGRFAEALSAFEKAYAAMPLPALLFNIGQCHFQEKRYGRAVFFYERYLEMVPDAPNRATVEGLIVESKKLDADAAARPPPRPAPPSAGASSAAPLDTGNDVTMWVAAGAGVLVAVAAGTIAWALWASPPAAGSLGLVDRRTP